jgi:alpha-L-fucosidase 2
MAQKLWYTSPASQWLNALPIGTGRLAAMVLGTVEPERVALNHEWLWRGANRNRDTEVRSHLLPEVRQLLLAGKYDEGSVKGNDAFGGPGGIIRRPNRVDPYQPVGDLFFRLEHGKPDNYRRELDLDSGLVTIEYAADGVRYKREFLAHLGVDLILVRLTADRPFSGTVWLSRTDDPQCSLAFGARTDGLVMRGAFKNGITFQADARFFVRGGTKRIANDRLAVANANEVLVAVNVGTSAKGTPAATESEACPVRTPDWDGLFKAHVTQYEKHYRGLKLEIDVPEPQVPTDERMKAARTGAADPALPLLYANFGRYLLVASSALGELPANLQGKWNEDLNPPWESDYHHDVNLQMNYWPAEAGHLQHSTNALFCHLERFVPHARKAAKDLYDCEGVWFPIQTDAWGRATPEAYGWAVWIGAAAWLAQHLWWHYEYGQDIEFLRKRAYPFFKEVAAFYETYLIEDEQGVLQVVPSQSPENRFVGGGKMPVTLCVSAAMDIELIMDLLGHAIRSAELLGTDPEKRREWQSILDRLPRLKIGSHGELLEWNQEFQEVEPGHRHYSHLVGLYPGDLIDPYRTPDLWQAGRVALERRLSHGGGHTGWSRAWTACFFARLGDAEKAWDHVMHLILDFATDSLLDLHPPRIFQIEGNLGGAAAILEMLLQSYHEELHFLPALPKAWPTGKVTGIRARGGFTVKMEWKDGRLCCADITPLCTRTCAIRWPHGDCQVYAEDGKPVPVRCEDGWVRFEVQAGRTFRFCPVGG